MLRLMLGIISVCALALVFQGEASAQYTNPQGNFDIYVRKATSSQFGFLSTKIVLPTRDGVPVNEISQKGVLYTRQYPVTSFDPIVLSMSDQIVFSFEGFFRIGGGLGSGDIGDPWGPYSSNTAKYYIALLDVFSVDIAPSYTHVFRNGTGLTVKCGFTIINLGATAAILDRGVFRDSGILVANVLPVQFSGSLLFDFGRSALGVSMLINASSILNYTKTPEELYNNDYRGLISSTLIKRIAFQIVYAN